MATDGTYKSKLTDMYEKLGTKYQWLDKEAIAAHGEKPYAVSNTQDASSSDNAISSSAEKSDCGESGGSVDGTGKFLQMRLRGGINQKIYQIV